MKKKPITSLSSAFDSWVNSNPQIKEGLNARKAETLFRTRMGFLQKYLASVSCKDRILYVTLYSSAMKAKMMMVKDTLVNYINDEIGFTWLKDIRWK